MKTNTLLLLLSLAAYDTTAQLQVNAFPDQVSARNAKASQSLQITPKTSPEQPYTWKGNWITNTENIQAQGTPYFRKVFDIKKPVKKASAYVCGVGYHLTSLNGKVVNANSLDQAFTKYNTRLLYHVYDVTNLISPCQNCIGAELGNGCFNAQTKIIWGYDQIGWRKTPRLLLNARYEIPGWNTAGFNDKDWAKALKAVSPGGALQQQQMPDVAVIKQIKPVSVKKLDNGMWLFNLGQNFAGVAELKVNGKAGDTAVMQYGERLLPDGSLDLAHNAGQMIGPATDPKFQTDIYILKGHGPETYAPRFTYHGFQYVQVKTSADVQLDQNSITGLFYSTNFKPVGSFSSSSTMLNKLYAAAIQSYQSNYVGIPTDCPQREKMGWLADAHVGAELGLYNFDAISGYRKWLSDVRDVQLKDGKLPGVAPTEGVGYRWIDPNDDDFGPAWGSALPLVSWYAYIYAGDVAVLQENYAATKAYVDYLANRAKEGIYTTGLDDFLAIEKTTKAITSTMFLYTDAGLMAKMAKVLGHIDDAAKYEALATKVKTAFNQQFFNEQQQAYTSSTLTALSGAWYNGLCAPQARAKVAKALADGVIKRNYKADFGVLGTKWVLSALSDAGYSDVALRLLTDTTAGWGKWIAEGATTLREGWDEKEGSLNHVFFGDYAAWYFKSLAGIQVDEAVPGFKHFFIKPVFPKGLDWISVKHDTQYGEIGVNWRVKNGKANVQIIVPMGTSASLVLPGIKRELKPGKYNIVTSLK